MEQRIVINLGHGTWQTGFSMVVVQLWEAEESVPMQFIGRLPAATGLFQLYERWRIYFRAVNSNLGLRQAPQEIAIEVEEEDITHVSRKEFDELCRKLKQQFNAWLSVSSFVNVDRQLRTHLQTASPIQLIVSAEDTSVRRFPWHLWAFLDDYPLAEVAISSLEHKKVKLVTKQSRSQIRVLSVFGDTEGIQVVKDQALLEQLRGVEAVVIEEPDRSTLNNYFWDEQGWDILFFAGHSFSENDGSGGQLKINAKEEISISQLKHGLKTAIQRGLKLAIFNSCDGIGLAKELADLHIPYLIIMREGVPDRVAQAFLMNFLRPFAHGESLYLAVREARERLQGLESQFPCASWLPVICQNPSAMTVPWQFSQSQIEQSHLSQSTIKDSVQEKQPKISDRKSFKASSFKATVIGILLITTLIIFTRALSLLQPLELIAYDHMMRVRPIYEGADDRIAIITVGQADIEYQREQGFQGGEASLKDEALLQILQKLESAKPTAVGLDIIHDFPFIPEVNEYINQKSNFFAICRVGIETSGLESTSAPDSSFPVDQMGFSNFPLDKDGKIRRQFLGMAPDEICQTDESLSFRMATQYIKSNDHLSAQAPDLMPERINDKSLRIGPLVFRKIDRTSGGYNLPNGEDAGYQVLVNYRKVPPKDISLRSFLTLGESRVQLEFKNKIVLIGGLTPKDLHPTPFDQGWSKTPGVIIHAQMSSNLISAFLDNRSLIHWWPQWIENVWILIWALGGAVVTSLFRVRFSRNFWAVFGIILSLEAFLYGTCLLLFTKGVWIPWIPSMLSVLLASLISLFLAGRHEKPYLKSIQARESKNFS